VAEKVVAATAALTTVGLAEGSTFKEAPSVAGLDRMATPGRRPAGLLEEVLHESRKLLVLIGAELGERRSDDRASHRNGYRPRRWDTRAGV
jgi:hypothetical protein